jgi:hypothetical protein
MTVRDQICWEYVKVNVLYVLVVRILYDVLEDGKIRIDIVEALLLSPNHE